MSGEGRIFIMLGVASVAGVALYLLGLETLALGLYLFGIGLLTLASLRELILERHLTVELLMAIVGYILVYHGVVFEGLIIYILYSIAETMEVQVKRLALRKIEKAKKLIPRRVRVYRDGGYVEVDASEVEPGEKILVRRGEVVPVDGVLLGRGVFDTSLITGESVPLEYGEGDQVESGYINVGDPVEIRAVKSPAESTLQQLILRATELLENKGRVQRLIERLSPYMIVTVLGVFALTYFFAQERAVAVLLAGCPSALIIDSAATTSYTVSLLAGRGVVVRGGAALESGSKVGRIIIDKTGTLTMGIPRPVRVVPPDGMDVEEFKAHVSAVATTSLHPISRAIATSWHNSLVAEEAREYPGKGVEARVNGRKVYLGSKEFISGLGVDIPVEEACGDADLVVYAYIEGYGAAGAICLEESIDEGVVNAVEELRSMGVEVAIASGDREERVARVAERLGIREYYAQLKPWEKTELVRRVRRECGCKVSMVGDGVNDLEALAESDFGVAIGNIDAVSSVSDAVLIHGFKDLPSLLKRARAYVSGLYIGFAVATAVKVVTIVFGLTGIFPLWLVALMGDDGSTLLSTLASVVTVYLRGR